jgi:acetyl esterase/lipase
MIHGGIFMKVKLFENSIPAYTEGADTPNSMTAYLLDADKPLPAVIVFPGGGYCGRADYEGEPIAQFYNSRGFHAFVVDYRVLPNRHPAPLLDAQRAVKLVRYHANEWKVDVNRVFTCGFSAGGHLCGCTAVMNDIRMVDDEIDAMDARPNGAILCYPVISGLEEHGHVDSVKNLLDNRYDAEKEAFSLHTCVNEKTTPCFIWHTAEDQCVPVIHSLIFAQKLGEHKIPYELHIFPHGVHGLGLATETPDVSKWADLSADWIINNF